MYCVQFFKRPSSTSLIGFKSEMVFIFDVFVEAEGRPNDNINIDVS